ncbi:MAG: glycine cleavage system protein GcvH [Pseudomonadota bacterium]
MSNAPANLKYTKSHEWVEVATDNTARIGISDHAQDLLGDLVFVELPDLGRKVMAGDACGVVESVKAASDVYSPVSGEVIEVNAALASAPELVNQACYDKGWLYRVKLSNRNEIEQLLDAKTYTSMIASAGE